jgi:NTE family protein
MKHTTCLVLSGGIALGAYQGGAYAALHERTELWPEYLAGSSIGAVNGAIIAATPPAERVQTLAAFWRGAESDRWWPGAHWVGQAPAQFRHAYRWFLALQTRMLGCPGVMRPRPLEVLLGRALGLYDLSPLRARLVQLIDFERLNRGHVHLSIMTTDVETGEPVTFDTARGDAIGPDHLIASCGFLPDFPPVQIEGRLLADGGLTANLPVEAVFDGVRARERDLLCFAIDLFASEGRRPATLTQVTSRALELLLSTQTDRALRTVARKEGRGARRHARVVPVRYRAGPTEPGPHRLFDFSKAALSERWAAGAADMSEAIASVGGR